MPQIEVTFDIDANGILNVSAKDQAIGREQKVEVKAGSGLSDEEIEKMVQDAEAHREEDRRFQELVGARNSADGIAHSTRASLKEHGDNLDAGIRQKIEDALNKVDEAVKGDDKDAIDSAVNELQQAGAELYKAAAEQAQAAESGAEGDGYGATPGQDEAVVDAQFTEVADDK